jgi:ABC-type molybdate transport system substrate-binding protein
VLNGAGEDARRFVQFLLGPAGQAVLARHGFASP